MKKLFLLSICFISFVVFAQKVEHISVQKKYKESDYFPSIEGCFSDKIPIEKLGSTNGIVTPLGWKGISYKLGYSHGSTYKTIDFQTNTIPDSVVVEISNSCLGEQIYFTDIRARDPHNIIRTLVPMSLVPILKKDE